MRTDLPDKLLLEPRAAAAMLSISLRTLESLVARGEIASLKIGRCRRISRSALSEFVSRRTAAAK